MVEDRPRNYQRGLIAAAVVVVIALVVIAIRGGVFISRISSSGFGGIGGLFGQSAMAQKLDRGDRVNILLLGYGGPNHDGPYLTDSILIVSVNPKTGQTAYISIPRDTEVDIHAFSDPRRFDTLKINAAFAIAMQPGDFGGGLKPTYATSDPRDGAFKLADDTLTQLTGVPIDYNVGADFGGFDKIVDSIGGVDITVPETFSIDFPVERNNGWITAYFQAGPQHMDGARALEYVRGRYVACSEDHKYSYVHGQLYCDGHPWTDTNYSEASDFARALRQQQFLEAFRKQALRLNAIANLPQILSGLEQDVRTDLSVPGDVQALWDKQSKLRQNGVLHISINSSNLLYSCTCDSNGYTLHPYGGGAMLQRFLAAVFQGPALKEKATLRVEDGSGHGGDLSSIWADLLRQIGFKVTDGGAVGSRPTTSYVDGTLGKAKHTASFLSSFFGAQPATAPATPAGQLTLVLGRDAGQAFYQGGAKAEVATGSGGANEPAPTPTGQAARPPESGGGGAGGGGGGGGFPSPPPLPLQSLLPKPP